MNRWIYCVITSIEGSDKKIAINRNRVLAVREYDEHKTILVLNEGTHLHVYGDFAEICKLVTGGIT